jgi:hypothetical protein
MRVWGLPPVSLVSSISSLMLKRCYCNQFYRQVRVKGGSCSERVLGCKGGQTTPSWNVPAMLGCEQPYALIVMESTAPDVGAPRLFLWMVLRNLLVFRNTCLMLLRCLVAWIHHQHFLPFPRYSCHQLLGRQTMFKNVSGFFGDCVRAICWLLFGFSIRIEVRLYHRLLARSGREIHRHVFGIAQKVSWT